MSAAPRHGNRLRLIAFLLALVALAIPAAGCGDEEHELDVPEGEPLELGEMTYDVQISRYLNPDAPEDAEYLEGAPPLEEGQQYFGIFMVVENEGDDPGVVPYPLKVVDTRGNIFAQERIDNPFTLEPGAAIEPGGSFPAADTPASRGDTEGSMVLFALDEAASEDRPLKLEIPGPDEVGEIELDI